jgi:preprotein translocase subunit SecG
MAALEWYDWILLVVSLLLITVIVLQNSKNDVSSAFSGEKSELFANQKQRGAEKVINDVTTVLSVLFFVLTIFVAVFPR